MTCEYGISCEMKAEDPCCFEGKEESCPLWRDFSVKEKTRKMHSRLNAVGSDKCQINMPERITRRVRLPDMDLYNDDALLCDAINKMGRL